MAAEPVFGDDRTGGDFGAGLGDGSVEEEVHGRDLAGYGD
jgi:hypothetical protein